VADAIFCSISVGEVGEEEEEKREVMREETIVWLVLTS
jgi:hypothetical protein